MMMTQVQNIINLYKLWYQSLLYLFGGGNTRKVLKYVAYIGVYIGG